MKIFHYFSKKSFYQNVKKQQKGEVFLTFPQIVLFFFFFEPKKSPFLAKWVTYTSY